MFQIIPLIIIAESRASLENNSAIAVCCMIMKGGRKSPACHFLSRSQIAVSLEWSRSFARSKSWLSKEDISCGILGCTQSRGGEFGVEIARNLLVLLTSSLSLSVSFPQRCGFARRAFHTSARKKNSEKENYALPRLHYFSRERARR